MIPGSGVVREGKEHHSIHLMHDHTSFMSCLTNHLDIKDWHVSTQYCTAQEDGEPAHRLLTSWYNGVLLRGSGKTNSVRCNLKSDCGGQALNLTFRSCLRKLPFLPVLITGHHPCHGKGAESSVQLGCLRLAAFAGAECQGQKMIEEPSSSPEVSVPAWYCFPLQKILLKMRLRSLKKLLQSATVLNDC